MCVCIYSLSLCAISIHLSIYLYPSILISKNTYCLRWHMAVIPLSTFSPFFLLRLAGFERKDMWRRREWCARKTSAHHFLPFHIAYSTPFPFPSLNLGAAGGEAVGKKWATRDGYLPIFHLRQLPQLPSWMGWFCLSSLSSLHACATRDLPSTKYITDLMWRKTQKAKGILQKNVLGATLFFWHNGVVAFPLNTDLKNGLAQFHSVSLAE